MGERRLVRQANLTTTFRNCLNADSEGVTDVMNATREFFEEYEAAREYRRLENEYKRNNHESPDAAR